MSSSVLGPPLDQHAVFVPIEVSDISFIIGYLLNFGLLGVLSIQSFIYATRFRREARCLHFTVLLVFFLEVFNSVLVMYSAIFGASIRCLSCLVTGQRDYILHGVPISETLSTWAFQALCVLTGLSSSIVQAFFAWRIWILGRSIWMPVAIIVVSLAQCVLLMTGGILSSTVPNLGVFDTDGAVIWLIISAACDILITVRTTQLLFRSRDESDCQATQSLVRKLIKMTIETGLVTVMATFLEFTIARTLGIAHHGVFWFLSKLYANCLLATLNARLVIHDKVKHDPNATGHIASAIFKPGDIQFSPPDAFGQASYGLGLGLYKTHPVPVSGQDPTSTPTTTRYRSVGMQIGPDTEIGIDIDTWAEAVWGGVETVSESASSERIVCPRLSPSPSRSTFIGSLESESDCAEGTLESYRHLMGRSIA